MFPITKAAEVLTPCCSAFRAHTGLVLEPKRKNVRLMEGNFGYVRGWNLYIRIYSRIVKLRMEKKMGFRFHQQTEIVL
jgi:hypothetical protein